MRNPTSAQLARCSNSAPTPTLRNRQRPKRPVPPVLLTLALAILVALLATPRPLSAQRVDEHTIDSAAVAQTIGDIRRWLYTRQSPDGSWEPQAHRTPAPAALAGQARQFGGTTALVVHAILVSGESHQHPKIRGAIRWLGDLELTGTYARAVRAAVWAQLPDDYLHRLRDDAHWLQRATATNRHGLFDYQVLDVPSVRIDHSLTQYGLLALWDASRRGVDVPQRFWRVPAEHFVAAQNADGGWCYGTDGPPASTGSMTCAGVTALLLAEQQLHRDDMRPHPLYRNAIAHGLDWLDLRFVPHTNPGQGDVWLHYYLCGVERVALASGRRYLNGRDWFRSGAALLVNEHRDILANPDRLAGRSVVDAAFALMFLARGR